MPVKFEWQFKHRDERFLNAARRDARRRGQKPSIHAGFLHFHGFRFTLPVGDRVTIANGARIVGWVAQRCPSPRTGARGDRYRSGAYAEAILQVRKIGRSSPGINRTGGKDEGVGNTSGSCLSASCRRLRIKDPPVEDRRSLHDQHLCQTAAPRPKPFAIPIQPFDLMSRRHPLSSIGAFTPMTSPASLPA